jgi:hypothetical protein
MVQTYVGVSSSNSAWSLSVMAELFMFLLIPFMQMAECDLGYVTVTSKSFLFQSAYHMMIYHMMIYHMVIYHMVIYHMVIHHMLIYLV